MQHANADERSAIISGLRNLADYLDATQEVPAPRWVDVYVFPVSDADDEMKSEIDAIAALIGSTVDDGTAEGRHYTTSRNFGPIQYRAVAIPSNSRSCQDEEA